MSKLDRKAATAAYKKRKPVAGIYAVRCATTGETWVGRAMDVETIQTRLWFGLRTGANTHPPLQKAWDAHGADSFSLEVVEMLDDEDIAYVRDAVLKDRMTHWRGALNAEPIACRPHAEASRLALPPAAVVSTQTARSCA